MNVIGIILLIASIVGLVKLHKDKNKEVVHANWFNKRNCIIVLVLSFIMVGISNQGNSTTATPTATKQSGPSVMDQAKAQVAKDDAKKIADAKVSEAAATADTSKMNSNILYFSQVKAKTVFKDRLTKVENDGQGILITFKLSDNLSMKLVGDGGFTDASDIFALYKGHAGNYSDVTVLGTYPMKDKYGNTADSVIFAITLDKDTINKTTFENITPSTDLVALSSSHAIRPELMN